MSPDPDLLQRIKSIIRRDLKLGPNAVIADDMPFFDSEADLDSLDILLLVTSIEKEFGIKIPSAEVGRAIFENPVTLTRYVQSRKSVASTGASGTAPGNRSDNDAVLSRLPHQEPFRFVTRVTQIVPGQSAEGQWQVSGKEAFFAGHFPGRPIVPGVLLAEALAQIAGIAGATEATTVGALAHVDVRFEQPISPPATITLAASLTRRLGAIQQFDVVAGIGDRIAARGTLALHLGSGESEVS